MPLTWIWENVSILAPNGAKASLFLNRKPVRTIVLLLVKLFCALAANFVKFAVHTFPTLLTPCRPSAPHPLRTTSSNNRPARSKRLSDVLRTWNQSLLSFNSSRFAKRPEPPMKWFPLCLTRESHIVHLLQHEREQIFETGVWVTLVRILSTAVECRFKWIYS